MKHIYAIAWKDKKLNCEIETSHEIIGTSELTWKDKNLNCEIETRYPQQRKSFQFP